MGSISNKRKKSVLDNINPVPNEIIEKPSIVEQLQNKQIEKLQKKTAGKLSIKSLVNAVKVGNDNENLQIINDLVDDNKIDVDSDVTIFDIEDVAADIVEHNVVENIPDVIEGDDIAELKIETKTRKRAGYVKTKVTVKNLANSADFSNMLTTLKGKSSGLIRHRACDIRSIAITNGKQLKNSDLKLLKSSYTIKPTGGVVNKSTRIIISLDVDNTNSLIVYLQKSRDKFIYELNMESPEDWNWLANWIYGFYETLNFNLYKYRLINRELGEHPAYKIIKNIAKTGKYLVSIPKNNEDLKRFKFKPIDGKNTHLNINVVADRNTMFKQYNIVVTSDIDKSLYLKLKSVSKSNNVLSLSLEQLNSEAFYRAVDNFINEFDNNDYNIEDVNYNKLRKRATRQALTMLLQTEGIEILQVLNGDETRKQLISKGLHPKSDYDSENIIFKLNGNVMLLQYLAIQTGEKDTRGYLTRPYKFKLVNGDNEIVTKDLDVVMEKILN